MSPAYSDHQRSPPEKLSKSPNAGRLILAARKRAPARAIFRLLVLPDSAIARTHVADKRLVQRVSNITMNDPVEAMP